MKQPRPADVSPPPLHIRARAPHARGPRGGHPAAFRSASFLLAHSAPPAQGLGPRLKGLFRLHSPAPSGLSSPWAAQCGPPAIVTGARTVPRRSGPRIMVDPAVGIRLGQPAKHPALYKICMHAPMAALPDLRVGRMCQSCWATMPTSHPIQTPWLNSKDLVREFVSHKGSHWPLPVYNCDF